MGRPAEIPWVYLLQSIDWKAFSREDHVSRYTDIESDLHRGERGHFEKTKAGMLYNAGHKQRLHAPPEE